MKEIKHTLGLILSIQKDMQKDIGKLDQKVDNVESNLNKRIDEVETNLNQKIDNVKNELNQKIDDNYDELNQKIDDNYNKLDHKIDKNRTEAFLYYKNLDKKLNDNLEDIGGMFRELFSNMPA